MILNYILIPENIITRLPRLGHRYKVSNASSPISSADRQAVGEVKDETTVLTKIKAYWATIVSKTARAFLKGTQTKAAAPASAKDVFNTQSFFSKFSRKSAFHRHLLHADQDVPAVPSHPDCYLPPSPRSPTVSTAIRRKTPCTRSTSNPNHGPRMKVGSVPNRNLVTCGGNIATGLSALSIDKVGSPSSTYSGFTVGDKDWCNFSPQNVLGQRLQTPAISFAFSPRNASILGQRLRPDALRSSDYPCSPSSSPSPNGMFSNNRNGSPLSTPRRWSPPRHASGFDLFYDARSVSSSRSSPHQSTQFFDYDSRLQPPVQSFRNDSFPPHNQEYTPHEPYFDHTSRHHSPVHGWSSEQNTPKYSRTPCANRSSPLEYPPLQPYFN